MMDNNNSLFNIQEPSAFDAGIIGATSQPDRFNEAPFECALFDVPINTVRTVTDALDGFLTGVAVASSLGGS